MTDPERIAKIQGAQASTVARPTRDTSHKARYAALGGAIGSIIVFIGKQFGVDLGPIGDPIAMVITTIFCAGGGAWIAPKNRPKVKKR